MGLFPISPTFEALDLCGAVFTSGKSGKMPYGQIKKYYRNTDAVINPGTSTASGKKTEDLQFYYHPDHLGSSNYITDVSGEVYQHQEYFPFGETFVEERNDAEYTTYLFNGKELDEETGLYYYGARYYDARISMWYGMDRLSEKYSEISPYQYAANNPIRFIDVNGDYIFTNLPHTLAPVFDVLKNTSSGNKLFSSYSKSVDNHVLIFSFFEKGSFTAQAAVKDYTTGEFEDQNYRIGYESANFPETVGARNLIGINLDNVQYEKFDKYDKAFQLYHELYSHIDQNKGSESKDHDNFGDVYAPLGMNLWRRDPKGNKVEIVRQGSEAWKVFKEILQLKVNDGKATEQNINDLKYMIEQDIKYKIE